MVSSFGVYAQVVKLVDTLDLGSSASRHVGSSPILGNSFFLILFQIVVFYRESVSAEKMGEVP